MSLNPGRVKLGGAWYFCPKSYLNQKYKHTHLHLHLHVNKCTRTSSRNLHANAPQFSTRTLCNSKNTFHRHICTVMEIDEEKNWKLLSTSAYISPLTRFRTAFIIHGVWLCLLDYCPPQYANMWRLDLLPLQRISLGYWRGLQAGQAMWLALWIRIRPLFDTGHIPTLKPP